MILFAKLTLNNKVLCVYARKVFVNVIFIYGYALYCIAIAL
ncbi:hypothetical protein PALI_a0603 [Pseudoalteromonas aliena SW19]|uniref:Uncharacterized protein n=1 Tax=Pseudoalteromonas aliena SW19 TaxID=1314866 RepID=A0ABR9DYB8_9GAMM|nr:hypothetical protein [Pseudoalteromonas aliena SW19]